MLWLTRIWNMLQMDKPTSGRINISENHRFSTCCCPADFRRVRFLWIQSLILALQYKAQSIWWLLIKFYTTFLRFVPHFADAKMDQRCWSMGRFWQVTEFNPILALPFLADHNINNSKYIWWCCNHQSCQWAAQLVFNFRIKGNCCCSSGL